MTKRTPTPPPPTRFPTPDRSNHAPNSVKSSTNDALDVGHDAGILSDGRPYLAEVWAADGVTMVTYFMSRLGLESHTDADFKTLVEREGLLRFIGPERYLSAMPLTDASGNAMWSVNVVAGDDEGAMITDCTVVRPYLRA